MAQPPQSNQPEQAEKDDPGTGMDRKEMKMFLGFAEGGEIPCAVGVGTDTTRALLIMAKTGNPKNLIKDLTDLIPEAKNTRFGTVSVDPNDTKTAKFKLNKPLTNIDKRLTKTLKPVGVTKAEVQT